MNRFEEIGREQLGMQYARIRGFEGPTDLLYCGLRKRLSVRAKTRAFWHGAVLHVLATLLGNPEDDSDAVDQ